jgi:hypothetical protein
MSWDCQTLAILHEEMMQTDLEYWAVWGKPTWSPDRTKQIKLVTHLNEEHCQFYCDLQGDKYKALIPITKTKTRALFYGPYIGKLSWAGPHEIKLTPKMASISPIVVDITDYIFLLPKIIPLTDKM